MLFSRLPFLLLLAMNRLNIFRDIKPENGDENEQLLLMLYLYAVEPDRLLLECSVQLQVVTQQSRGSGHLEGTLILMRTQDRRLEPGAGALVLGVGGDTLMGLAQQLEAQSFSRPMALDLLWQASLTHPSEN